MKITEKSTKTKPKWWHQLINFSGSFNGLFLLYYDTCTCCACYDEGVLYTMFLIPGNLDFFSFIFSLFAIVWFERFERILTNWNHNYVYFLFLDHNFISSIGDTSVKKG